jgi:hypothetical protein
VEHAPAFAQARTPVEHRTTPLDLEGERHCGDERTDEEEAEPGHEDVESPLAHMALRARPRLVYP